MRTPRERKPHDDAERLPKTAKLNTACFENLQKEICDCVPQELRDQGQWKYLFSLHESIGDNDLTAIMNSAIEKGRHSNHRIYIGPCSDGQSDDKMAVDIKFEPKNTKTTFKNPSYCRTVYARYDNRENPWECIELMKPLRLYRVRT